MRLISVCVSISLPVLFCSFAIAQRDVIAVQRPQAKSGPIYSDEQPFGSLRRPSSGLKDPQLDAAWQTYGESLRTAAKSIHAAIDLREREARELGNIDSVELWQAVRATFKADGVLLAKPCSGPDMEATIANVEKAEKGLFDTYATVVREKTKEGADQFARATKGEKLQLERAANIPFPPVCENLLLHCDPETDAVAGKWTQVADGVKSDDAGPAKLRLPFDGAIPKEFDYVTVFTPESGEFTCAQLLTANGVGFGCDYGGWGNTVVALHLVDRQEGQRNKTTKTRNAWLRSGEINTAVLKVRRDSVSAVLNGEQVFVLPTDYTNLGQRRDWAIPVGDLGVGSWHTPIVFHRVHLIPK